MSPQQSYLVTLNGEQKIIINPDGTWHRVCAVVPDQVVERDLALEPEAAPTVEAVEPIVVVEAEVGPIVAVDPTEAPAAAEPIVVVETAVVVDKTFPDWWGDGPENETNVAPGWTRCETEWGQGWCHDDKFDGKSYGYFQNWDDAVRQANIASNCGGITKTFRGYSLRGTRQCIYQTETISRSKLGLACWSKDYIHNGKKFTPTRNPIIPHRQGKNHKERDELAIQYDMESQQEFEEWISNGCE
jgi:hypothetical protein